MFGYNILALPSFSIEENIIKNIFLQIEKEIKKTQKWTLNIVFVKAEEIQKLNKNYRNIDKFTDVLSFHYYDDFEEIDDNNIAGEIILCEEKIISQAIEYWLWEEKEFYKLMIHSILHILWYDHENNKDYEIMKNLENKIWKDVFKK